MDQILLLVPKEPPTSEYIVAIEKACLRLPTGKAEVLRGEIKAILKKGNQLQTQYHQRRALGN